LNIAYRSTGNLLGISWNNDGTQLSAFSLEGKQWILDISDSGISINKAATERLRKNVEDQLKDAFRKVMADEKDSENESDDGEGDDDVGSPPPFNFDGLDSNFDDITNEDDEDAAEEEDDDEEEEDSVRLSTSKNSKSKRSSENNRSDYEETMVEDSISKSREKDNATNSENMDIDEGKTYTSDLLMQPQMLGIDASANGIFVAFVFAYVYFLCCMAFS